MDLQSLTLPRKLELQHFRRKIAIVLQPLQEVAQQILPGNSHVVAKLKLLAQNDRPFYDSLFVADYLLIKTNALKKYAGKQFKAFAHHLSVFYNEYVQHSEQYLFRWSYSDAQLMAQVLLKSNTYHYLSGQQVNEVLDSSGIVAATMLDSYFKVKAFLKRDQEAVGLSLTSLYSRINPFLKIIHQEKNHKGQCDFAATIFELKHLDPKAEKPNLKMVQDAYSLRCTPQVHGVVYDCLSRLESQLVSSVNKPQTRYITFNGVKLRNLLYRSENETLILDSLVCSLNEIGHMSFLRSERILNKYLTSNNIALSEYYDILKARLQKVSYLVAHNKNLAAPTNADTVIMDNYKHDIYVDEGTPFMKVHKMIANLTELIKLEVMASMEVLFDIFGKSDPLFVSERMEKVYRRLFCARKQGGYEKLQQVMCVWWQE